MLTATEGNLLHSMYAYRYIGLRNSVFTIKLFLPVTIAIIPDVLVTNPIQYHKSLLIMFICNEAIMQTQLNMIRPNRALL